jgi:hypothetical protein
MKTKKVAAVFKGMWYFLGVPIIWKSKSQKSVTLSSSKAEYFALSEAVDNIGAICMAENVSATSQTKHIDRRYHLVRVFVVDGFVKIVFVKITENKSDMFTKNVSGEAYDEHIDNYIMVRKDITRIGWTTWEGVRTIAAVWTDVVLPWHMNVVRGEISPVVLCKIIRVIEMNLQLEGVNVASKRYSTCKT